MNNNKTKYDERQLIERGKAFTYAFWIMFGLVGLSYFLHNHINQTIFTEEAKFAICAYIPAATALIYMIIKDAYDGISAPQMNIAVVIIICAALIAFGIFTLVEILERRFELAQLVFNGCFISAIIVYMVH